MSCKELGNVLRCCRKPFSNPLLFHYLCSFYLIMSVLDGDFPEKHVMSFKHIIVVNAPVEWESHGFVVWVFLVESTAVRQRVLVDILGAVVVSLVLLKVSDHDKQRRTSFLQGFPWGAACGGGGRSGDCTCCTPACRLRAFPSTGRSLRCLEW